MLKFKSKVIDIAGKKQKVVVINHKKEEKEKEVSNLHHIHILDRSGSMSDNIDELIENVKTTIDFMNENDFVSVIWFASAGQYKTLIKGAKKDDSIKLILDSIKSTMGCTCFSDPLREVGEIINELSPICPNFNITLFTDGEPVCPWSDNEEIRKINEEISEYVDRVIAINTIGYGNYYNKSLLTDISKRSEFGEMIHSSQIQEYSSIFNSNYERIKDLIIDPVNIEADNCQILYLGTDNCRMEMDEIHFNMLENKKNQFIIIGKDEKDFIFSYQDKIYNSKNGEKISDSTVNNILYALCYQHYYVSNRDLCLDILSKNLRDKALIDRHMSVFTNSEVAEYMKELKNCLYKPKYRMKDGACNDNYLPKPNAICVFDILKYLSNNDANYVYNNSYKRIGMKTEDTFNLFTYDNKIHETKMEELILSEKELNISIRSKLTGTVKINPKQAKKVGLPDVISSYVYRNQSIIKDGNLNMDKIYVTMNDYTFKSFILSFPEIIADKQDNGVICINLTNIPIINRAYSNSNSEAAYIYDTLTDINEASMKLKVVENYLNKNEVFNVYNEEQIEVLREHGLDRYLCYGGVGLKTSEKNEDDYYISRVMEFNIKGFSSLPSFNSSMKKIEQDKKLNKYDQIIKSELITIENAIKDMNSEDRLKFLIKSKKAYKSIITNGKINICIGKISSLLTGGWIKGMKIEENDKYSYVSQKDDGVLILTAKKIKKYF